MKRVINKLIDQFNEKSIINYEFDEYANNNILATKEDKKIYKLMDENLTNDFKFLIEFFSQYANENEFLEFGSGNNFIIFKNDDFHLIKNGYSVKISEQEFYNNFVLYEFTVSKSE